MTNLDSVLKSRDISWMVGWYHRLKGQQQTLGDSEEQGSLGAVVHGVAKSQTRLSEFTLLHFRVIITILPKSKHLLISWLKSPSAVILEPKKIKSVTVSIVSPFICHEAMGPDAMILVF